MSPSGIETEVIGEFKKQVPSPLSFPFECLDMLGTVNLEETAEPKNGRTSPWIIAWVRDTRNSHFFDYVSKNYYM